MLRHASSLFVSGWARESSFHFCIITNLLPTHLHICFNPKKVGLAYIFSIQSGQESELESHDSALEKQISFDTISCILV